MANDTLTNMLIFVMAVNVMLFFGQIAMISTNPSGAPSFWSCDKSEIMKNADLNGCRSPGNYTFKDSYAGDIPTASTNEDSSGQNFFTDIFNTLGAWIRTAGQGLKYLGDIIGAPYHFLTIMLPNTPELAFGLATLWYAVSIFLLIGWITGGAVEMFYNETETMGRVIQGLTNDVTGAYALTFLLILLMLFLIAVVFRLSFELIVILVTPIILVLMAYSSDFLVIGVIWLILDAVIIAKNIIIK